MAKRSRRRMPLRRRRRSTQPTNLSFLRLVSAPACPRPPLALRPRLRARRRRERTRRSGCTLRGVFTDLTPAACACLIASVRSRLQTTVANASGVDCETQSAPRCELLLIMHGSSVNMINGRERERLCYRRTFVAFRGFDGGSGATGMMVTPRVADSGLSGTVPEAKPLLARRRRRKFWGQSAVLLIFEWFLSG